MKPMGQTPNFPLRNNPECQPGPLRNSSACFCPPSPWCSGKTQAWLSELNKFPTSLEAVSPTSLQPPPTGWQSPICFFTWKKPYWKMETDLKNLHLLIPLWLKEVNAFSQETIASCLRLQRLWTPSGCLILMDYISMSAPALP